MTLQTLELTNSRGSILTLPIGSITSGYSVQDIDGLDPVQASQASSSFAGLDGEQYQSAHVGKRNITLKLGLETDYTNKTVRQLRRGLYELLMPKSEVNLKFVSSDDFPDVNINGVSESFSAPLFVEKPSADVSILCYDPYFVDPLVKTEYVLNSDDPNAGTSLFVNGDIPVGIRMTITVMSNTASVIAIHNTPMGRKRQDFGIVGSFLKDDVIEVSTVPGDKYAHLIRGAVTSPILHEVSTLATWISLESGQNVIGSFSPGVTLQVKIQYNELYGGL